MFKVRSAQCCGVCNIVEEPLGNNNSLVRNGGNRRGLQGGACDCMDGFTHS